MKTIRLKFITDAGKPFVFGLNYAAPSLETAEGKDLIQNAADTIIRHQPFSADLAGFNGADLIDRTVVEIL